MYTWDNTTASRKITRTQRYNEESWQAGRHTLNTGVFKSNLAIYLKRQLGVQILCVASYDIGVGPMVLGPGH